MGIPRRIAGLKPFAEVSRGITTSVYKALDPETDRVVAVKLLRREWISDETLARRFAAEAAALQSVENENVVAILDHGKCEAGLFIVTEFVEGASLDELMSERTVPAVFGLLIVRDALAGLEAVHRAGIIHRDFKPANIVVRQDGTVKLVDFGFADPALTPSGGVAGTAGFLAPEVLAGQDPTEQSDLFSVGITLLQAATGSRSDNSTAAPGRHRHDVSNLDANRLELVDEEIRRAIGRLAEVDTSARPASATEALSILDTALGNYRPEPTRVSLAQWLAGESRTLPRRLLREPVTASSEGSSSRAAWRLASFGFAATLFVAVGIATVFKFVQRNSESAGIQLVPDSTLTTSSSTLRDSADSVPLSPRQQAAFVAPARSGREAVVPSEPTPAAETGDSGTNEIVPTTQPDLPPDSSAASPATQETDVGTLSISAAPWARVSINDEVIGTTPIARALTMPPGRYSVRFTHPEFPDLVEDVVLTVGDSLRLAVSMWASVARLHLSVSPWAVVIVDGTVRDTIPMQSPLIVPPGETRLTLRHPDLGDWSTTLELSADSVYNLRYNLYELAGR